MPESGDFFGPLGLGDLETPDKRGRFINIEAIDAYIEKATMETVTITTGTLVDITVSGTSTLNDVTINNATIDSATITDADIDGGTFGTATIDGDLTVGAWLSMTTSGGIRTASSGQRIEFTNTNKNFIAFYSGDADEERAGFLSEDTNGAGTTRTIQFGLYSPYINTDDQGAALVVRSASADATTTAPGIIISTSSNRDPGAGTGLDPVFSVQNEIQSNFSGNVRLYSGTTGPDFFISETDGSTWLLADTSARTLYVYNASGGNGAALTESSLGFGSNNDDQLYQVSDSVLGIKIAGNRRFSVSAAAALFGSVNNGEALIKLDAVGTASTPAYSFYGYTGHGMYAASSTQVGLATAGTRRMFWQSNVVGVDSSVDVFRIASKTTTGDPTATADGDMYVNTADNVLKIYEGGSWRTVASW